MSASSESPFPWHEVPVAVRYAETDAMGVVHHASYLVWLEVARTAYCERAGYPYARMEADGTFIAVTGVNLRYRRSARYGDTVLVRTRLARFRSRACAFEYALVLPDGSVAVEGHTDHVFLDRVSGRPCPVPSRIAAAFRTLLPA